MGTGHVDLNTNPHLLAETLLEHRRDGHQIQDLLLYPLLGVKRYVGKTDSGLSLKLFANEKKSIAFSQKLFVATLLA